MHRIRGRLLRSFGSKAVGGGGTHERLSLHRLTSLVGLLGTSAPCQSPFKQWENWEAGVLLYSRFQESRIILLGGSSSRGFFGFGFGFSSSVWAGVAGAGAAAGVDEFASFGAGWALSLAGCFAVFSSLGGAARIIETLSDCCSCRNPVPRTGDAGLRDVARQSVLACSSPHQAVWMC